MLCPKRRKRRNVKCYIYTVGQSSALGSPSCSGGVDIKRINTYCKIDPAANNTDRHTTASKVDWATCGSTVMLNLRLNNAQKWTIEDADLFL